MRSYLPAIALAIAITLVLGSCVRWEWRECRQVGHGRLYCFIHLGKH